MILLSQWFSIFRCCCFCCCHNWEFVFDLWAWLFSWYLSHLFYLQLLLLAIQKMQLLRIVMLEFKIPTQPNWYQICQGLYFRSEKDEGDHSLPSGPLGFYVKGGHGEYTYFANKSVCVGSKTYPLLSIFRYKFYSINFLSS